METIRTPRIMQETSKRHLYKGKSIGLVPTMGALHNGHLSLVKRAKNENDIVAASIFVNPSQFGKDEDFDKYPRDAEQDAVRLQEEGVDILFMPDTKSIYPDGFSTNIVIKDLSERLCGAFRPGHFKGVATVVCKLLNIVKPTRAYFGQKDFQQTVIVKRMAEDLNMDIEIVTCPTIRESDGLAMSSRNSYLSPDERRSASVIYNALLSSSQMIKSGSSNLVAVKNNLNNLLKAEPFVSDIQYAGIYDPETLVELSEFKKQNLLAVAVKIGSTRLIDNM
ncbi:MAG: pantoate--beta-alanine ligase, partial [Nitrospirae bacterium]|nr:pantoate--beta-alanine ligase [Nitrospirota bacterium]